MTCDMVQEIEIRQDSLCLQGFLGIPFDCRGIVIFAHGSGSGRHSSRNQHVAKTLRNKGLATLLIDLLTVEEEQFDLGSGRLRFDISFLAKRLITVTHWVKQQPSTKDMSIGYFGASTGAAAALVAAALNPRLIHAIVSRGGRPDLANKFLPKVIAPTLLIVGDQDHEVLALNVQALQSMVQAATKLEIVPGATHLFEEPGALDQVAELAQHWFDTHLYSHLLLQPESEPGRMRELGF